jgi:hypothetical protein
MRTVSEKTNCHIGRPTARTAILASGKFYFVPLVTILLLSVLLLRIGVDCCMGVCYNGYWEFDQNLL